MSEAKEVSGGFSQSCSLCQLPTVTQQCSQNDSMPSNHLHSSRYRPLMGWPSGLALPGLPHRLHAASSCGEPRPRGWAGTLAPLQVVPHPPSGARSVCPRCRQSPDGPWKPTGGFEA